MTVGWIEIVAGVILTLALARGARERGRAVALLVPLSALGLVAYRLIDLALGTG